MSTEIFQSPSIPAIKAKLNSALKPLDIEVIDIFSSDLPTKIFAISNF
jgi:hypothetical protein